MPGRWALARLWSSAAMAHRTLPWNFSGTAIHTATDAVDKLFTTAESHHRVMVVEVMGRDAGWIALEAGLAGGAHVILIPEIPFTIRNVCQFIAQRESY